MILIIGRSGTGKTALRDELSELGIPAVMSYTTRPRRTLGETGYRFVTEEEALAIPDRVLESEISGYRYFTRLEDLKGAGLFVVDPEGAYDLHWLLRDEPLEVIYVSAPEYLRRSHAIARSDDPRSEKAVFDARAHDEDAMFSIFEHRLVTETLFAYLGYIEPGSVDVVEFVNDYDHDRLHSFALGVYEGWASQHRKKIEDGIGAGDTVREAYMKLFPSDSLGACIAEKITFSALLDSLYEGDDFYDTIGVGDSLVRERLFDLLVKTTGIDRNGLYDLWMNGPEIYMANQDLKDGLITERERDRLVAAASSARHSMGL